MKNLFLLLLLVSLIPLNAQNKYLVYFKDKGVSRDAVLSKASVQYQSAVESLSRKSIERRKKVMGDDYVTYEDLPVDEDYVKQVEDLGADIVWKLKWFNAVSCYLDEAVVDEIENLPFVNRVETVGVFKAPEDDESFQSAAPLRKSVLDVNYEYDYGLALIQLELSDIPAVHDMGITGEGVTVGMLDTGFNWEVHPVFQSTNVIDEYDFVYDDDITANEAVDVFDQHNHGTYVFSIIGGFDEGNMVGSAFGADFVLAKTENLRYEKHIEEDNFAAGLQWLESYGIDIASASLGYSIFDKDQVQYTYEDMDGQSTIITLASELAFQRGVVVVNSAGNEGDDSWHYITAPADGENVIAVAAVTSNNEVTAFSGRGPSYDGRIKPDIAAMGSNVNGANPSSGYKSSGGTSSAAPIASGVAALLMSAHPHLTNGQVRDIMLRSGDSYENPDTLRGYGLISAKKAVGYPNLEHLSSDVYKLHKIFIGDVNTSTVKFFYDVEDGGYIESSSSFNENFRYIFDIPLVNIDDSVSFYFTYEDGEGNEHREPSEGNYKFGYGSMVIEGNASSGSNEPVPGNYTLSQNYPNPFNGQTVIEFSTPKAVSAKLVIYNVLGQKVKTLYDGTSQPGKNILIWNGTNNNGSVVSAGPYFYALVVDGSLLTQKLIFLK